MSVAATRILVVEDDAAIRRGVVDALRFQGYVVAEASDGDEGLEKAFEPLHDLLLLDLVLPGKQGLDILKEVRLAYPTLPVIILTAKGDETDRVNGLKIGADDYVVKPFSVKELLARIEAVLRRSPERPQPAGEARFDHGEADLATGEVHFKNGKSCRLFPMELDLLRYLASNAGRAVSREEILSRVWHMKLTGAETRTVDMHVARLREKLRDDVANPRVIKTIRGKGYVFGGGAADP
jgi:DNA-binding response OmpR family regulator